ncbi:MAG: mechanosensitive ion channel domain-containing protein, partial [Methyloceanibacter sp.]
ALPLSMPQMGYSQEPAPGQPPVVAPGQPALAAPVEPPATAPGQPPAATPDKPPVAAPTTDPVLAPTVEQADAVEDKNVAAFATSLDAWQTQIKALKETIADKSAQDEQLREVPSLLEALKGEIVDGKGLLRPRLEEARARLDKLGAAPDETGPKESPEMTAQRERLGAEFASIDGLMKRADVLLVRATQLTDAANAERRDRFAESLFRPVPNYYSRVLPAALERTPLQMKSILEAIGRWIVLAFSQGSLLLILLVLAPIGGAWAARRLIRRIHARRAASRAASRPASQTAELTPQQRASAAVLTALESCAPVWAALAAFYLFASALELVDPSTDGFLAKTSLAIAWTSLLVSIVRQSLVPEDASRRLLSLDDSVAWQLALLLWGMIAIWLLDQVWGLADSLVFTPYQMTVLRSTIVAILYGALLMGLLLLIRNGSLTQRASPLGNSPRWLFWSIAVTTGFMLIALLLGYPELARFTGSHLVSTAGVLWIMYLLHLVAELVSRVSVISRRQIEDEAAPDDDLDATSLLTIRIVGGLLADIVIVAVGITILLLLWRFDWVEVKGWIQAAFFGVQFGDLRISLQSVLIALGVFVVGLLLTRFVQRWFINRAFAGRQKDRGLQESARMGLGYVGFVLSALAGVSYLGLDFSSLAIVAGALSVGIGFGLQSIVNNFVSGIILLVERPIKIGDWIAVGEFEGAVKKISVRSTEIETIYRQSVIIPNANLISNPVTNWMHADRSCRLDLPIGVSYGTDVAVLRTTLLEVAAAHKAVVKHPVPIVHFAGFGDSSLDFELRVYLRDAGQRVVTASELRFAILAALNQARIEIPFPQRDIHIKDAGSTEEKILAETDAAGTDVAETGLERAGLEEEKENASRAAGETKKPAKRDKAP